MTKVDGDGEPLSGDDTNENHSGDCDGKDQKDNDDDEEDPNLSSATARTNKKVEG